MVSNITSVEIAFCGYLVFEVHDISQFHSAIMYVLGRVFVVIRAKYIPRTKGSLEPANFSSAVFIVEKKKKINCHLKESLTRTSM